VLFDVAMNTEDLHRYTIDEVGRLYTDGKDVWLPSVSTVLGMRETPEALKRWKQRQDDYDAVMSFKQNRGTLIHEAVLSQLTPQTPDGDPIKRIWGDDERNSAMELWHNDNYRGRYDEQEQWALETFELIEMLSHIDTVVDVETFVTNTDIGYAGQFDLLYHDASTDETVLADLKTSKACYEKHLLQLTAYKHAVPMAIDRMEVIRMNPDNRDWEVFSDDEWDEDEDELFSEFCRLRGELEQQKLHTIIDTIQDADASDDGVLREEM